MKQINLIKVCVYSIVKKKIQEGGICRSYQEITGECEDGLKCVPIVGDNPYTFWFGGRCEQIGILNGVTHRILILEHVKTSY